MSVFACCNTCPGEGRRVGALQEAATGEMVAMLPATAQDATRLDNIKEQQIDVLAGRRKPLAPKRTSGGPPQADGAQDADSSEQRPAAMLRNVAASNEAGPVPLGAKEAVQEAPGTNTVLNEAGAPSPASKMEVQEAPITNAAALSDVDNASSAFKNDANAETSVPVQASDEEVDAAASAMNATSGQAGSSADSRWYFSALLFRSDEADDQTLMGYKEVSKSDEDPQGMPDRTITSLSSAFYRAMLRLPMHFVRETGHSMLPMLIATLPVVISGLCSQAFRQSLPEHTGSIKEMEFRAPEMDTSNKILTIVSAQVFITVIGFTFYFMVRALWKKDVMYWWLRTFLPFCLFQYVYYFVRPFLAAKMGGSSIDRIGFMLAIVTQSLATLVFFYTVGRANKNRFFLQYGLVLAISVNGIYALYRTRMPMILAMSDLGKTVVVGFVNPLLLQLFVVLNVRMASRALHFNDPSTSWCLMGVGLVWEKAYARIIIATMDSVVMVGVASLASAAGSGLILTLLGKEDLRVYQLLGACLGVREATRNRDHPRNATFRTNVYCFDFAVEMALIVGFAVWPHAYNISFAGKPPDWGTTFAKLVMQLAMEYGTNGAQIIFVTLKHGIDYLVFAHTRCQYWSFMAGVFCAFPTSMMCTSMIVTMLCGAPKESGASYQVCEYSR